MKLERTGLTLLELIIVMVILVTVSSLAIPVVYRSYSAQRVNKAADLVRAEMNKARVMAMRSSEIHGFFYYPETANFRIGPFDSEVLETLNASPRNQQNLRASNFEYGNNRLPQGVLFAEAVVVDDSRSATAQQQSGASLGNVRPILFYPDGSSQTAKLYLRSDQNDFMEIKLRGMTGTTSADPVNNNRVAQAGNRR